MEPPGARDELALMTIRSEGQFNTVVYEDDDMAARGLEEDSLVKVTSAAGCLSRVRVRSFDIRQGNCAMYFPEANAIVPRDRDPRSKTPAYKSVVVTVVADDAPSTDESGETVAAGARRSRTLEAC
jgi:anaerobic selenocysteine-containing dehydrogenase